MEDWTDLFKKRPKDELGAYTPENAKFQESNEVSREINEEAHQKALDKKFKKLKHQISYLGLELEDITLNFKHAQKTFIQTMFEYCSRKKIDSPFETFNSKSKKADDNPDQIKELYREIVKITHPDKNRNLSDTESEYMANLYYEASEGKTSGDFHKILSVAMDLNIEIHNVNPEILDTMKSEIKKMNKKISKMKNDIMYKWFYANPDQQQKVFESITKNCKPINQ